MNKVKSLFSSQNILVVIGILVFLAIVTHKRTPDIPAAKPIAATGTARPQIKATPSRSALPATSNTAPQTQVLPTPAQISNKVKTHIDLCRDFAGRRFRVPKDLLRPLLTRANPAILVPEALQNCLTDRSTSILFSFADFNYREPLPFYTLLEPLISVTAIEKNLPLSKIMLEPKKIQRLGFDAAPRMLGFYSQIYGPEFEKQSWSYIEFTVINKRFDSAVFLAPQSHPFARTVSKMDVQSMQQRGALILDTRPASDFAKASIPQTVSIPVSAFKVEEEPLSVEDQRAAGYTLFSSAISKDLNREIIVVNQNPKSFSAYNALTQLYALGFRNLRYYWGGIDDWQGKSIVPPSSIPKIRFIGYNEMKSRVRSPQVLVVDVRNSKRLINFFPRSIRVPFQEKKNVFGDPLNRAESLSVGALSSQSEGFKSPFPPIPTSVNTFVVAGDNIYDWKPLKAAILLSQRGNMNIEVYLEGMRGWKFFSSLETPLQGNEIYKMQLAEKQLEAKEKKFQKKEKRRLLKEKAKFYSEFTVYEKDPKTGQRREKKIKVRTLRPDGTAYKQLNPRGILVPPRPLAPATTPIPTPTPKR